MTRRQRQRQTTTSCERARITRDDGYYYVVATRLYRVAIQRLDRCAIMALIGRLMAIMRLQRGWAHVAAELHITLSGHLSRQDIDRIYRV